MPRQTISEYRMSTDLDDEAVRRLMARRPKVGDRVGPILGTLRPSGHEVAITVEYRARAYRVAEVTVTAGPGSEITSGDIGMPVKETAERALAGVWAMFGGHGPAEYAARRDDFRSRQRGRLSDEFLAAVAETYRTAEADEAPSLIEAVDARHGPAGYSTVRRWIAEARRRGFLPPATRGRRPVRGA